MKRIVIPTMIVMIAVGCQTESERVAELATRHATEQSELSRETIELQTELAEGTRQLVEADSQSRRDFLELEANLAEQRAEIGDQHDVLERERRELARQRHRDPIIANAVTAIGTLMACLLPLLVAGYLLKCQLGEQDDHAITEVLLEEIANANASSLQSHVSALLQHPDSSAPKLPDDSPSSLSGDMAE